MTLRWLLTIATLIAATAALLGLGRVTTQRATSSAGRVDRVRQQWLYQPSSLLVGLACAGVSAACARGSVLRLGDLRAPATGLGWLGIEDGTRWSSAGLTFSVVPFLVTSVVAYLQVLRGKPAQPRQLSRALLLALPFAALNALTEELVFRATLVHALGGLVAPGWIALVSGLAFGVPHWFGTPGKLPGVAMAGFLGWAMARAALDTGGLGWPWLIHFVQDVPILTMMILASISEVGAPRPTDDLKAARGAE